MNLPGSLREPFSIDPQTVISPGPLDAPTRVVQFPENHRAADLAALLKIIGGAILYSAQQHIPGAAAADPCKEFSSGGAEYKPDLTLRTGAH